MSGLSPTERKFEEFIEYNLQTDGYRVRSSEEYDRKLCLIRPEIVSFLKVTQPIDWERLTEIYGDDTERNVLKRIATEVSKRGVIDVLRNQVIDRGVYLSLCYFEPKSDMNPDHSKLYEANQFSLIRQLRYSTKNENSLDLVLFLNGLPIVTMELKNQLTGQNFKHAENQYRNDRDPREPLFKFKRCIVHFCVDNDRVSMTTRLLGNKTYFLPYNQDLHNPPVETGYRTKYLWEEILTTRSLLDIIENFVHVSEQKEFYFNRKIDKVESKTEEILIFPRYHQLTLIRSLRKKLKVDGVGNNYLVQHTTGSGKSYSIGWLAHTLTSLYRRSGDTNRMFDTIVVVSDRKVLDDQLRKTIRSLEKVDGVVNGVQASSEELRSFLEQGKDIVVTTIQKFPFVSQTIASLGNRKFAVIIDEVHSSQSGELSKELKKTLSKTETDDEDDFDYEEMIRKEIRSRGPQDHISFFGFTGTPKQKTLELFGTKNEAGQFVPYHVYSMHQSIHEGFTLDVLQNYTTYQRYFRLKQTRETDFEIQTGKGKKELVKFVDYHDMTIQNKVQIMLDHWLDKGSKEIQGKARGMIVTQSRKQCVKYFKEVNRQLNDRGISYRCLVGFSGEVTIDDEKFTERRCNLEVGHEGNVPHGLKNPKSRLLVVANKFQTGFDEPLLQTMYVDKRLGGVQCVQTLSRLNRTTTGKSQTFVLDFVNQPDNISESFGLFYQSTLLEGELDPNSLYDTKRKIYDFNLFSSADEDKFCRIFYDPKRDEGELHSSLDHVVEKFNAVENCNEREDFRAKIQSYGRMYGYLSQIITFTDIELEKTYVFLKYLNKKLPKRNGESFNLADAIDLDSLRIQQQFVKIDELDRENSVLKPLIFDPPTYQAPQKDFLSELIEFVNGIYGNTLTEADRVGLSQVKDRMFESTEIKNVILANNTEQNRRKRIEAEFDKIFFTLINEKLELFNKLQDNRPMKNTIFQKLYDFCREETINNDQPSETDAEEDKTDP